MRRPGTRRIALSHGSVAEAFVDQPDRHVPATIWTRWPSRWWASPTSWWSASRGAEAAGPLYVQSVGFDCLGEVVEAEDAVRAALRAEPAHRAAGEAMAGYLEDRGDAARALDHLRRAGVRDDDPQMVRLAAVVAHAGPKAARNDPCPCGSGKKYKACCIDKPTDPGRAAIPVALREGDRLRHAPRPVRSDRCTWPPTHWSRRVPRSPPRSRAASDHRFAELSLFDEGQLERFLDEREPLLPAAEVEIAEAWLDRKLGLYEVTEVRPGEGMALRDIRFGRDLVGAGVDTGSRDHGRAN